MARITAAVTAAVSLSLAGAAVPATASTAAQWRLFHVWGTTKGAFRAVAATGPANAWAVGSTGSPAAPAGPLVAHWNGTAWQTATPSIMTGYVLTDVRASSPANVWAFGEGTSSQDMKAFRFDGAHWHAITLPTDGLAAAVVFGAADAWVMGGPTCIAPGTPLTCTTDVWQWTGSRWSAHPLTSGAPQVMSLAGTSDGNLWAAGTKFQDVTGGGTGTIVAYRFNGSAWSPVAIPRNDGHGMPAIAMDAASDIWIAADTRDNQTAFALHFNGKSWQRQTAPGTSGSAGPAPDGHGGAWLGPFAHWTGHAWITPSLAPPSATSPWAAAIGDVAVIPGASGSYWAPGDLALGSGPFRPMIWLYGPRP
jgi:hypothetical protein